MVTSFLLTTGYAFGEDNTATPEMIKEIAKGITIEQLKAKCFEYGLTELRCPTDYDLDNFIEKYRNLSTDDITCIFVPEGVLQSASSGTGHRDKSNIKEENKCIVLELVIKRLRIYINTKNST